MQIGPLAITPIRIIPALGMMAAIFVVSSQPGDHLQLPEFLNYDKAWHLLEYAILAATYLYALSPAPVTARRTATALGVVCLAVLYGISDEYHQSFVPFRNASLADVIADGLGAMMMAGGWWLKGGKPS